MTGLFDKKITCAIKVHVLVVIQNWVPDKYVTYDDNFKINSEVLTRAYVSSSHVREGSPILSLSWWGWRSCYESVVLGAPFTPAGSTAEAERRVAHSISCDITL